MSVHVPILSSHFSTMFGPTMFGLQRSRVMSFDNREALTSSSVDANNNSNTQPTRRVQAARRRLFNDDDNQDSKQSNIDYCYAQLAERCEIASKKYNFDFVNERPLSNTDDEDPSLEYQSVATEEISTKSSAKSSNAILMPKSRQSQITNLLPVLSRARSSAVKRSSSSSSCESSKRVKHFSDSAQSTKNVSASNSSPKSA